MLSPASIKRGEVHHSIEASLAESLFQQGPVGEVSLDKFRSWSHC